MKTEMNLCNMDTNYKNISDSIKVGTLGPEGTNSEIAAINYMKEKNITGYPILYNWMEEAIKDLVKGKLKYCIACSVYPNLHKLTFDNVNTIKIQDAFVFDTLDMVFTKNKDTENLQFLVSHPAPVSLLMNSNLTINFTSSNSEAAILCKENKFDCCITTQTAALNNDLKIIRNFGSVAMSWTVFTQKSIEEAGGQNKNC